jgi:hypothetical protein
MVQPLHKLPVSDALERLTRTIRKPAEFVTTAIEAAVKEATTSKGMEEERLYIHKLYLGRNRGIPGIRYHAKGRAGRMLRPRIQLTVELAEKTVEKYAEEIVLGKFSAAQANEIRQNLLIGDADLSSVKRGVGLLTAKGRQQKKLMFDRKVAKASRSSSLHPKRLREKMLGEETAIIAEKYRKVKTDQLDSSVNDRRKVYERNLKR